MKICHICLIGLMFTASLCAADGIPFEAALEDANVRLPSMTKGHRESLILGNGDMYGVVWEHPHSHRPHIRVTKNDIWDARVDTSKDGPLPKVDVTTGKITGSKGTQPSWKFLYPAPRCAAAIKFLAGKAGGAVAEEPPEFTGGTLDLEQAVVTFSRSGTTTVRILADRNVMLVRTPDTLKMEGVRTGMPVPAETGTTNDVDWLYQRFPADENGDWAGMDFALAIAAKGDLKALSLVTSYDIEGGDVLKAAMTLAKETIREEESRLIALHEKRWQAFWSRSGVELADKDLQRWWYRLLYFAKTVCEPGNAPVALMPPLVTDATPWHGDFHHNYNAWQAFWPLPGANQAELADPWISYIHSMMPRFKNLAKVTYDIDGICVPISSFLHEPDPALSKSKHKRQVSQNPWGLTIGLVGMTLQSMWHKHLCAPDRDYLEAKIYPSLKEGAKFYVAFMERCKLDEDGKVLLGPSYSPEHGPMGVYNCPFDIAYVRYTLNAFIQASGELKKDSDLAEQCGKYKALLGDYPTTIDKKSGKPVVVDWKGCVGVGNHNIEVPLSPVFPAEQVTWFSPEPEKELFRHTIRSTARTGDNSHIMFNIAKARLSMLEAIPDAKSFFVPRTLPNGLIQMPWKHGTHMQETIGLVALVNEFVMQSVGDIIRIFPCWPKDQDAKFADLRAQGGFLVSAEQKGGEVVRLEIESTVGGTLRVLSPWGAVKANGKVLAADPRGVVSMETKAGQSVVLSKDK